jgi:hypothetical protein
MGNPNWDPKRDTPAPTTEAFAKRVATVRAQTEARQRKWLTCYAEIGTMRAASDRAGVSYRRAQSWRAESEADPSRHMVAWPDGEEPRPFHELLEVARQMACDLIEEEVQRRALGHERELVYKGRKTGETIREHSDLLLIFRAKRMIPAYRDNYQVEHTHSGKVEIGDSARDRLAEKLLQAIERRALAEADPVTTAIDVTPERAALPAKEEE